MMDGEVLFEIKVLGSTVKVTAIDPVTGTEAVIQGPVSVGEKSLRMAAAQKLRYLLSKQKGKK